MAGELDVIAADAAGGWLRFRRKAEPAHATHCANCGVALLGPWCHACGQSAEDFHRSILRLSGEAFESFFHFDGRVWRTLPDLMLRPARLTKRYLEGHRAPQIPPLRLFLVVLLLVFLCGPSPESFRVKYVNLQGQPISEQAANKEVSTQLTAANQQVVSQLPPQAAQMLLATENWGNRQVKNVLGDPARFLLILEKWGERFAFLMLPMATLLMCVLFLFQRRFYIFDHAIFSLHSLSAMGLLLSAIFLFDRISSEAALLAWWAPIHLFRHMRGVYGTTIFGTLARMALLFVASSIGVLLLVAGLIAVGLSGMD